jgi:hypothetical protein
MFIAALFSTAKRWKQVRSPSTEEWINQIWYAHTIEYYSAIKTNDILYIKSNDM